MIVDESQSGHAGYVTGVAVAAGKTLLLRRLQSPSKSVLSSELPVDLSLVASQVAWALSLLGARGLPVRQLELDHVWLAQNCEVLLCCLPTVSHMLQDARDVRQPVDEAHVCRLFADFLQRLQQAAVSADHQLAPAILEVGHRCAAGKIVLLAVLALEARTAATDAHSLEISWSSLEFVKVLGSGKFGEVQLMRLTSSATPHKARSSPATSQLVAVKTIVDSVSFVEITLA